MRIPDGRRVWRWLVVAAGVAVLCSLPSLVRALPVDADAPAADQREVVSRVLAAAETPHEGLAEVRGTLGLPDIPQLRDATALLGETTRARVWWAGKDSWRVAQLRPAGERDTYRVAGQTLTYDYERNGGRVNFTQATVRLPRIDDLLPPFAARWLLADIDEDAVVSVLPSRRVGGLSGFGVRVDPVDFRTSIASVRVWADEATSLPLRVEVWARNGTRPAFVSEFLSVRTGPPSRDGLAVRIPPDADMEYGEDVDYVTALDRRARWVLPRKLVGVTMSDSAVRARGAAAYGSGSVRFVVVPGGRNGLSRVIEEAEGAPGTTTIHPNLADVLQVRTPLLHAAIVVARDGHAYLIAGTVTENMLRRIVAELLRKPPAER